MIFSIMRTGFMNLRRDRAAFILSFIVPLAFFSIFAVIFGQQRNSSTARVPVVVADEDRSERSQRFVAALQRENALRVQLRPARAKSAPEPPLYDRASAEAAVRSGDVSVAIVIPQGFGAQLFNFPSSSAPAAPAPKLLLLTDSSDPIAPQIVAGMLQKTAMTAMPDAMADSGMKYFEQAAGGLTPQQRAGIDAQMKDYRQYLDRESKSNTAGKSGTAKPEKIDNTTGLIPMESRDIVGENKRNPLIAFYAAGVGVMFMLFSASGAGGVLLDEAESGTLDRILATRVSMSYLMAGKLAYITTLGVVQLLIMFTWGALVFKLDLLSHLPGFFIMAPATAVAAASFGLLLASVSRTRAQLAAISTLIVLSMSAVGGSMFPRFIMSATMQKIGLLTFNAWALDGFTKVFWREEPLLNLWPQVSVLLGSAVVFFAVARHLVRKRWEFV